MPENTKKDEFEEEIEKELEKEIQKQKSIEKSTQKSLSESEKKLAEIQAEKMRLKAVMYEKQGKQKPKSSAKSSKNLATIPKHIKKKKLKKPKTEAAETISTKEKIQAQIAELFSWENIKSNFKKIFSVENLIKYKWLVFLTILILMPTIVFFGSSAAKLNQLVREQSPQLTQFNYRFGEELFTIDIYTPMPRDDNSTQFHQFSYEIQYVQEENTNYLLPLDQYYVTIHNITLSISFKDTDDPNSYWYTTYVETHAVNQTLHFGDEGISGNVNLPLGMFADNLPNSTLWDIYMIQITLNATHVYNPEESEEITASFQGNIINMGDLRSLNINEANNFALMILVGYLFFGIFFFIAFMLWLRKKRFSFITPY
ncbi:MAG: hypothetical protein ACTSRZ_04995 [Promethearchaeota archaeon]